MHAKLVVIVLLVLLFFAFAVILSVRARVMAALREENRESALLAAKCIVEKVASRGFQRDQSDLRAQMQSRAGIDRDIAYMFVVDGSQRLLADTFEHGCPAELVHANPVPAGESYGVKVLDTKKGRVWDVAVPFLQGGGGTVRVGISQARPRATVRGITGFLILLTGCIVVLGSLAAYLLTSAATTQGKELEEAIRRSRAFLQTVIDAIPDGLLVIGTDYRIVLANRAARDMVRGIDPTGCLTCHQLSHHHDQPCAGKDEPCPLRQVIANKVPVTVTHTHCDAEGKEFFVEVSAAPVLDETGEVSYVIEACRDITDRKRAENDLKALNETLDQRVAERTKALQMLHEIAVIVNQAQDAEQAMEYCLRCVAAYSGWSFGHVLLPTADKPDELVPAYVHYPKEPERFRRFRKATRGIRFYRGQGLPGRVFISGKPEWNTDVRRDLSECRAALAEELGIATAMAFPVLVGQKVAAVLEFFSDRVIQPDGRMTDAMAGIGMQLGRVVERADFEEHLLTAAEAIRRGIAQDLHNDVGQELTGLGLKAETLAEMLASAETPAGKLAADVAAAVDRTRGKVRGLSRGLLPVELEEGLLADAIGQLVSSTTPGSDIACTFACSHPDPVFDSGVAMHLYRIAQEAVSNAVRHSGATNVRIALDQENGEIVLRIEDDGKGLRSEAAQAGGMGLRTMRYRAGLIGGKLEVGPGPSGGTQVVCRLSPRNASLDT